MVADRMVDGYIISCWPDASAASSAAPITVPDCTRMLPGSTARTLLKPVMSISTPPFSGTACP